MAEFSQTLREARIDTPLGEDVLLLARFSGEEHISRSFAFHVELQSERSDIDPAEILRQNVALSWVLPDGSVRWLHGHVSRFLQGASDDALTTYWADIVPYPWFLSLRRDCRIFQKMTVPDIVAQILRAAGYADFEVRCEDRPEREFCVQYQESDLDFVQRLLEEEGIFYFYVHDRERHTLVLADSGSHFDPCPPPEAVAVRADSDALDPAVTAFEWENTVRIGSVAYRDYDMLQPTFTLDADAPGERGEPVYEYRPGRYTTREEGERYARYAIEAEEALREQAKGRSGCRNLVAGHRFTLEEHTNPRANQEYVLTSVRHVCTVADYRSRGTDDLDYRNEFTCIPASVPFRPRRTTAAPRIVGSQTAVVVGPAGEEIYTDAHGRVKLHFHWDRLGKRDENSSCWVRVSQPWAGQGWGAMSVPRIGQEVVVDFLEGDPNQPIVTGRVYNAQNTPPYPLPDGGNVSGIKSCSTPGGGGYNEISMSDAKGEEKITIHAQYDMDTTIENDETHTVVGGTQTVKVKGDTSLTVEAGKRSVDVTGGDYDVQSSDAVKLHGKGAGVSITGDAAGVEVKGTGGPGVGIDGTPNVEVTAAAQAKTKAPVVNIEGTATCGIKTPMLTMDASATALLKSPLVDIGDSIITIHGSAITLTAGGSSITIDGSGVTIAGAKITSVAGGPNTIMGAVVNIN